MGKIKFTEVSCPRCKMEGIYSLDVLKGKDKLICPSCLAEFYPNYMVKQKIKELESSNSEVEESTVSEEIKIDAIDNMSLNDVNIVTEQSIE